MRTWTQKGESGLGMESIKGVSLFNLNVSGVAYRFP